MKWGFFGGQNGKIISAPRSNQSEETLKKKLKKREKKEKHIKSHFPRLNAKDTLL